MLRREYKRLLSLGVVCLVTGLYFIAQEKEQSKPEFGLASSEEMGMESTSSGHGVLDLSSRLNDTVLTKGNAAQSRQTIGDFGAFPVDADASARSLRARSPLTQEPSFLDPDATPNSVNPMDFNRTLVDVGTYLDPDDHTPDYTNEAPVNVGDYLDPDNYIPGYANQLPVNVGEYRHPNRAPFELNISEPSIHRYEGPFIEVDF